MDLLNCKTVHDVAYYLQNRTSYNKLLAGINENEVSRSELEVLLKQKSLTTAPILVGMERRLENVFRLFNHA